MQTSLSLEITTISVLINLSDKSQVKIQTLPEVILMGLSSESATAYGLQLHRLKADHLTLYSTILMTRVILESASLRSASKSRLNSIFSGL